MKTATKIPTKYTTHYIWYCSGYGPSVFGKEMYYSALKGTEPMMFLAGWTHSMDVHVAEQGDMRPRLYKYDPKTRDYTLIAEGIAWGKTEDGRTYAEIVMLDGKDKHKHVFCDILNGYRLRCKGWRIDRAHHEIYKE